MRWQIRKFCANGKISFTVYVILNVIFYSFKLKIKFFWLICFTSLRRKNSVRQVLFSTESFKSVCCSLQLQHSNINVKIFTHHGKFFRAWKRRHFTYSFQVGDYAMQSAVHEKLYTFCSTNRSPRVKTRASGIEATPYIPTGVLGKKGLKIWLRTFVRAYRHTRSYFTRFYFWNPCLCNLPLPIASRYLSFSLRSALCIASLSAFVLVSSCAGNITESRLIVSILNII